MENYKITETDEEYIIKVSKTKNYSIDDLKQKLINYLYNLEHYEDLDIEVMKILLK